METKEVMCKTISALSEEEAKKMLLESILCYGYCQDKIFAEIKKSFTTSKQQEKKGMKEKILPIPCTKVGETSIKGWLQKINEELDELKNEVFYIADHPRETVTPLWVTCHTVSPVVDEATDVIIAITSMLEAMGIDEEMRQKAMERANKRNKERGRF